MTTEANIDGISSTQASTDNASSWMEQTQYIARTIYEDPSVEPIPLDLHSACANGNYDLVKESIDKKAELNNLNKGGWTPLMYASSIGHDTVVNLLLEAGVDPNVCSPSGLTPLMVAAGCGNESICYFLLQAKANINQCNKEGYTALHLATRQGHHSTLQLLLKEGADVEIRDKNGYTPLMIAASQGDQIVLDVLIACNANVNAKSNDGHTARSLALQNGDIKLVSFLDEVQMMYIAGSTEPATEDDHNVPNSFSEDDEEDLLSEPEKINKMMKKSIEKNLGYRSGERRSLPTACIHRPSIVATNRRLKFRSSVSLPESNYPPMYEYYDTGVELDDSAINDQSIDDDYGEGMAKLAEFLEHLGLEKYYAAFEARNIDFNHLMQLSSEEMKEIVDKMGPRRRLEVAIKQLKEEAQNESSSDSFRQGDTTPTPNRDNEKELKVQVMRLQSALNQAAQNLESCESRLVKEYELRKMSERYCQELQQCRAQTVEPVKALKETQQCLLKQCQSLKSSHKKLSSITRLFSSENFDTNMQSAWKELLTSVNEIGGEIEAVIRTSQQSNKDYKAINYQLNSFAS